MTQYALPCIVCGTELEALFAEHGTENQPNHGVCFSTQGHYGSRVFDPMDGTMIEINVCDTCLAHAATMDRVYATRRNRPVGVRNTINAANSVPYTYFGYEMLSRPRLPWRSDLYGYAPDDRLLFDSVEELKAACETNPNIVVDMELLK